MKGSKSSRHGDDFTMSAKRNQSADEGAESQRRTPSRIKLPGFLIEDEVGLGDVVKRATSLVGLAPCGGCAQRAATLNRAVAFVPRHR